MPGQPVAAGALAVFLGPAAAKFVTEPLPLRGPQGKFFETPRALAVSAATGWAVLGHIDDGPGSSPTARFEWCDLTAGRTLGSQPARPRRAAGPQSRWPAVVGTRRRPCLARRCGWTFGRWRRTNSNTSSVGGLRKRGQVPGRRAVRRLGRRCACGGRDARRQTDAVDDQPAAGRVRVAGSGVEPRPTQPGRKYLAVETSGGLELYRRWTENSLAG